MQKKQRTAGRGGEGAGSWHGVSHGRGRRVRQRLQQRCRRWCAPARPPARPHARTHPPAPRAARAAPSSCPSRPPARRMRSLRAHVHRLRLKPQLPERHLDEESTPDEEAPGVGCLAEHPHVPRPTCKGCFVVLPAFLATNFPGAPKGTVSGSGRAAGVGEPFQGRSARGGWQLPVWMENQLQMAMEKRCANVPMRGTGRSAGSPAV